MNKNCNIFSCTWWAYSCGSLFFLLIIKSCSAKLRLLKCLTFKLHKHCCMAIAWNKYPECYNSHLLPCCIVWECQVKKPRGGTKKGKSVNNSGSGMLCVSISKSKGEQTEQSSSWPWLQRAWITTLTLQSLVFTSLWNTKIKFLISLSLESAQTQA